MNDSLTTLKSPPNGQEKSRASRTSLPYEIVESPLRSLRYRTRAARDVEFSDKASDIKLSSSMKLRSNRIKNVDHTAIKKDLLRIMIKPYVGETSLPIGARFFVSREKKGAIDLRGKSAMAQCGGYVINFNGIDTSPFDPRMHARLAYITR